MQRRLFLLFVLAIMTMGIVSCGSGDAGDGITDADSRPAHALSREERDLILSNMADDFATMSSIKLDNLADLSRAFTGSALKSVQDTISKDRASGKFRVRIYDDIRGELVAYSPPIAQVSVEYTDSGYYVDINTGNALDHPTNERKTLALAMEQEDGCWKISGIYTPLGDSNGGSTATNGASTGSS